MTESAELKHVTLADKFDIDQGRIFINGSQAITRLPLIQKSLDEKAGLNTSGFISGYRGSPMGMIDSALWQEKKRLAESHIIFQPGVNEDLAAAAVWGTQQFDNFDKPLVDGVFSFWYGKGPGVDRSGDVFRHANLSGTHRNGGVLLMYGDDHPGKSSTVVCQSEPALAAMHIPSLYPADTQEIIDFGLLGWAMSRYSGLWVGIKCVNETVEQTQTVDIDLANIVIETPDQGPSGEVVNNKPGFIPPTPQDIVLKRHRLPLVHRFVRANNIDKVKVNGKHGLGIVTSGKTYQDVIHGMNAIGLSPEKAEQLGIGVYKVGCIWPLEPTGLKEFALDRPELLFIEEKNGILEDQAAKIFINEKRRPVIVGKLDKDGDVLLVSDEQLDPNTIAQTIAARLSDYSHLSDDIRLRCDALSDNVEQFDPSTSGPAAPARMPYFCSGCPHNTSTKVPEGSKAMAGIGCHAMAVFKRKDTLPPIHMGGEGMNWAGAAHFSGTQHMFQNLGDGTYFHSGLMAIRGAVASKVNITYKILYNDAVAMTGGQPIDGTITVADMIKQVQAEGVVKCVLVTDNPKHYSNGSHLPAGIDIHHRDDLEYVQKLMREIKGITVLIYEQTCAAEKRRRRKRGNFPNPAKRLFINDAVCEGCGDCSVQSTCVSIQPKETEFGTKRHIDQSSCNKDYSCVKGFCPSFVTVEGAEPRKLQGVELNDDFFAELTTPDQAAIDHSMSIMIAGIGGTGVITVGAVLGMAAHLQGKACSIYDMTGLSQKNGAVYSHLRIAEQNSDLSAQRIGLAEADLIMGFDLLAALSGDAGPTFNRERTKVVGNGNVSSTIDFQFDRSMIINSDQIEHQIERRVAHGNAYFVDASTLAQQLCGDTVACNMFMVGYTTQLGLLPLSIEAISKAIHLNGVAVEFNLSAFSLGRLYAQAPDKVMGLLSDDTTSKEITLDEIIENRAIHLTGYQNENYAKRYKNSVARVRTIEKSVDISSELLTTAVAKNLAKLMSYKDEYEVARLYSSPEFTKKLKAQFEDGYRLKFNLAPPLLSKTNKSTGLPMKAEYGTWVRSVFKVLAKLKGLRGTALDIFGKTTERKMERQLISDYESMLSKSLESLNLENIDTVIKLAETPEEIRGYGHIKEQSVKEAKVRQAALLETL